MTRRTSFWIRGAFVIGGSHATHNSSRVRGTISGGSPPTSGKARAYPLIPSGSGSTSGGTSRRVSGEPATDGSDISAEGPSPTMSPEMSHTRIATAAPTIARLRVRLDTLSDHHPERRSLQNAADAAALAGAAEIDRNAY